MKETKIYISVPITGRELNNVKNSIERARKRLKSIGVHEDRIVDPLTINAADGVPETEKSYGELMGVCIRTLIDDCTHIYYCDGYAASKGCRLEERAAELYRKKEMYSDDDSDILARKCYERESEL